MAWVLDMTEGIRLATEPIKEKKEKDASCTCNTVKTSVCVCVCVQAAHHCLPRLPTQLSVELPAFASPVFDNSPPPFPFPFPLFLLLPVGDALSVSRDTDCWS